MLYNDCPHCHGRQHLPIMWRRCWQCCVTPTGLRTSKISQELIMTRRTLHSGSTRRRTVQISSNEGSMLCFWPDLSGFFQWDGTSHSRTSILEHSPFPVFAIQLYPSSSLAACLSHHLLLFSRRFQAFQTLCFIHIFVFQAFDHWEHNYRWGEEQNTQPSFLGQGQRHLESEAHRRCGQVTCPCFYWNCSSIWI